MSKSLANQIVRLTVPAGKATASPPVGPALGARGVKSIDFVKEFNARTAHIIPNTPTPVKITITPSRTFTFTIHPPSTSHLLKLAAALPSLPGSKRGPRAASEPNKPMSENSVVATISVKHIWEICRIKMGDLESKKKGDWVKSHEQGEMMKGFAKSVVDTAKSMGIKVIP